MTQIKLSATSLGSFKACPMRFRLRYIEGLRPDQDTESQRVGTNWHALHETYRNARPDGEEAAFDAAIEHLNEAYAAVPDWADATAWEVERQTLATCFAAYLWYYSDDPVETLATEQHFELPLHHPKTGLPISLAKAVRLGKMDQVIRYRGRVGIHEYKSTSKAVDDSSDYWERIRLDTQVSMYDLAFHDLPSDTLAELGVRDDDEVGPTLYDVWHKPTIKPAVLTQTDTKEFLKTGVYHGDPYTIEGEELADTEDGKKNARVIVDGDEAEVIPGKKAIAVRETPAMFGSRLMADILARPEFYFRRRLAVRTAEERARFRTELYNLYRAITMFDDTGCWYQNGSQCRATFACEFIPICHGTQFAEEVCDGESTPTGFQRVRVDLTIGGEEVAV